VKHPWIINLFIFFYKNEGQEGKVNHFWELVPLERGWPKERVGEGVYNGSILYPCMEIEK
jgi:hypothetical protein